jgi:LysM repeat protein
MILMHARLSVLSFAAITGVMLLAAACGGAGENGDSERPTTRLSDPAAAPSSTPISGDLRYLIRDNVVSAPDGLTTAVPNEGGSGGGGAATYTVEPGDICGAIASRLGVALEDLLKANPLIDSGCTNLRAGQVLKIPVGSTSNGGGTGGNNEPTPTPRPGSGVEHVVKEGDLCVDIAASYGVDVDEMIALNNLDCGNLQIDQVIKIP